MSATGLLRRATLWALLGASLPAGAAAFWAGARALPSHGRPAPGVFVGARVAPPDQPLGAWLEHRRLDLAQRPITLMHGFTSLEMKLGDLGIELDVGATMGDALRPSRSGPWRTRLGELRRARRGEIDVPLRWTIDERKAELALASIAPAVRRDPKDARLDLDAHVRVPEVVGEELDPAETLVNVMRGVEEGRDVFVVATRPVGPRVTSEMLSTVDIEKVVSSFETRFQLWGTGAGRAVNIARAAGFLDGTVLMPGQELSYNGMVGPRTRARGFTDAPEIVGDELQNGVGGGVCQVASTLYAAALFGALDVQERWAHGRPSSYTRFGLDATVSYPAKDLRFRNALPYPVLVHVYLPRPDMVRAEILGGEPIAKVEYLSGVARSEPFARRIARKSFLAPGKAYRHQKGIKGYSVYSLVRTRYPDGRVVERGYSSEYRPTPEIFWVSDDYDETQLPPLPDGAIGQEGHAAASAGTSGAG